jgi:hypothetical protein
MQAFTNLKVALDNAETKFMTAVITNGAPVAKGLTDFTNALSNLATSALNSKEFSHWATEFGNGMTALSNAAKTGGFSGLVDVFASGAKAFAGEVIKDMLSGAFKIGHVIGNGIWSILPKTPGSLMGGGGFYADAYRSQGGPTMPMVTNASYVTGAPSYSGGGGVGKWGSLNAANGLPPGTLENIERIESGGNPFAVSGAGAQGAFQFMPGTWAQMGQGSVWNPQDAAAAAGKYLSSMLGMFGGNMDEAVAGYNAGPGAVQKAIAKFGASWLQHLPQQTQAYVANFDRGMGQGSQVAGAGRLQITINNNTGGDINLATSSFM